MGAHACETECSHGEHASYRGAQGTQPSLEPGGCTRVTHLVVAASTLYVALYHRLQLVWPPRATVQQAARPRRAWPLAPGPRTRLPAARNALGGAAEGFTNLAVRRTVSVVGAQEIDACRSNHKARRVSGDAPQLIVDQTARKSVPSPCTAVRHIRWARQPWFARHRLAIKVAHEHTGGGEVICR